MFRFESVAEMRLEKIIYSFGNKLSTGKDVISSDTIKRVLPVIIETLYTLYLVNPSLI